MYISNRMLRYLHTYNDEYLFTVLICLYKTVGDPWFDTQSGHILSFLLPLIQERQLSGSGESMCTKYWLTAKEV